MLGATGLVAFVLGLALRRADLFLLGLALLLAVLGSHLALLRPAAPLLVHRSIRPDAVNAGEDSAVTVVVRSGDGRPVPSLRWEDPAPRGVVAHRREAAAAIPGDPGAAILHYDIRAPRRGVYEIGPLRIHRLDPLGLAVIDIVVGRADPLLVRPRVSVLDDSPLDESVAGGAELVVMRRTTPSVDEVSAREYERGDPMRRVNWRASAKRGRLMVRQEEQRSDPQCWLLLDTVGTRAGTPSEAFELAMALTASIGVHAIERGFTVGIVETGLPQLEGEEVRSAAGFAPPEGGRLLVAQLATVAPASIAADAVDAFAEALRRAGAGTTAFAVLVDGGGARWRALAGLRALAEPAIAFLLTPDAASARADLESAGWVCVVAESSMGVVEAWAKASEAAARRVGAGRV